MKKWNKGICLFVIVLLLACITTAFVTVHGATIFDGTITDSASSPNDISGVQVVLSDSLWNIMGVDYTDSNGEYSISTTLTGNTPYLLTVSKTRFDTEYKYDNDGGENNFDLEGDGEKLAYLFYATDALHNYYAGVYEDILKDEGYTVYLFGNCDDVESECEDIDDYEIYSDTIFVYATGHGDYSGGHTYTYFDAAWTEDIRSDIFNGWVDEWEAERKCILVDSCESQGWADDFDELPYLAMSSTDDEEGAQTILDGQSRIQGKFSHYFFDNVDDGDTAVQAFNDAEDECSDQYPKKEDNSSYTWFN